MKPERILLPLTLIDSASEKVRGRTKMQKFVFLIQQNLERNQYSFVPYDYGPFAKTLAADLDKMEERGFIRETENEEYGYEFEITDKGKKELQQISEGEDAERIRDEANHVVQEWNEQPLSQLLNHVYSKYPEYAENSVL